MWSSFKRHDLVIARWVSHLISPHIVAVIMVCGLTFGYSHNPAQDFLWLLFLIPLVVFPPIGYILWLVHTGYLEDFYMPNRAKRLRPLAVLIVWLLICWALIPYWHVPIIVEIVLSITIVLVSLMSLITMVWKISFHAATVSTSFVGLLLIVGLKAWPVLLLIPLVCWSRVRLGRHTRRQVLMGCLVGILVAWLTLGTGLSG